jgi:hypothetical protein
VTWEWPVDSSVGLELLGHARLALRVAVDRPVASVSAKLCDVAPCGSSTLITRGFLNLTHRYGHTAPRSLTPGEQVDVEVELEATSWTVLPGRRLRLAVTATDWPNTIAAPRPVRMTIDADASTLRLPVATGSSTVEVPTALRHLDPPAGDRDHSEVTWRITDDVLAHATTCAVEHGSTYDIVGEGSCTDHYAGAVVVDRRSWSQSADSSAAFSLSWPEATVRTATTVDFRTDAANFDVTVTLEAAEIGADHSETVLAKREWTRSIPRRLA